MTTSQNDASGEVTRLAAELRRLREKAGLSFTELAEQTPYSRSAWQRYLTGKVLPPWPAVRDLCRVAGEPEPRLRALWELAESVSRARGAVMAEAPEPEAKAGAGTGAGAEAGAGARAEAGAGAEPTPGPKDGLRSRPATPSRGRTRISLVLASITALALAAVGVYLLHGSRSTSTRLVSGPFSVSCTNGSCAPTCHGATCIGQDPQLTLCGAQGQGRSLIEEETPGGIDMEIRYSPQCQAAWARFWNTQIGDTLTLTAPGEPAQGVRIGDSREEDAFIYTPLVFVAGSGSALKACIRSVSDTPDCYTASTAS